MLAPPPTEEGLASLAQQFCVEWVELPQHTLDIAFAHVSVISVLKHVLMSLQ